MHTSYNCYLEHFFPIYLSFSTIFRLLQHYLLCSLPYRLFRQRYSANSYFQATKVRYNPHKRGKITYITIFLSSNSNFHQIFGYMPRSIPYMNWSILRNKFTFCHKLCLFFCSISSRIISQTGKKQKFNENVKQNREESINIYQHTQLQLLFRFFFLSSPLFISCILFLSSLCEIVQCFYFQIVCESKRRYERTNEPWHLQECWCAVVTDWAYVNNWLMESVACDVYSGRSQTHTAVLGESAHSQCVIERERARVREPTSVCYCGMWRRMWACVCVPMCIVWTCIFRSLRSCVCLYTSDWLECMQWYGWATHTR